MTRLDSTLPLRGPRIQLRDFTLDDLPIYRHWLLPGHRWQDFDAPYGADESAEEVVAEVEDRIARLRTRLRSSRPMPDPRGRLLISGLDGPSPIGTVSWYWIDEDTWWPAAGIGIWEPERWGQGLGFEALGLWTDYLFARQPRFVRLDLRTWSGNLGMMRLAEKLGYRLEARFRKARIVRGEHYDSLGYGILSEEWRERYPDGFRARLDEARV